MSAAGLRVLHLSVPEPIATLNVLLRMHHRAKATYQRRLCGFALRSIARQRPAEPFRLARVTIVRFAAGTQPDHDGLVGGAKALIDVLLPQSKRAPRGLGVITDDGPNHIELVVRSEASTRAAARTEVVVEELVELPAVAARRAESAERRASIEAMPARPGFGAVVLDVIPVLATDRMRQAGADVLAGAVPGWGRTALDALAARTFDAMRAAARDAG